jgi:hypothetical protein
VNRDDQREQAQREQHCKLSAMPAGKISSSSASCSAANVPLIEIGDTTIVPRRSASQFRLSTILRNTTMPAQICRAPRSPSPAETAAPAEQR